MPQFASYLSSFQTDPNYNIINSETMFTKQARAALQIRVKAESILILMCDSNIVARLERGG
ncbi:hypothetical protein EFM32_17060 [Lactiplantibacillus plantarum]|nr:hypothetical protein B0667_03350 [Lactiplantibacillus plantarum]MCT0223272.1 hypothetical protein [Lactiplantibacillus plantarum]